MHYFFLPVSINPSQGLSLLRGSLAVQWLGLHPSTAGGTGFSPSQGMKAHMSHGTAKQNKKEGGRFFIMEIKVLNSKLNSSF